jgi:preprotein translocase subunit SecF
VAALIHDVVLTIGVFSLLQIRFDLATIAALLTIIGYSINDTVVIFDRLRENLIKYKQRALQRRDEPVRQRDAEPDLDDQRARRFWR